MKFTIDRSEQLLALLESLGENEPEGTLPLTIENDEIPGVLTITYRVGSPDEVVEHVHDDGRITS